MSLGTEKNIKGEHIGFRRLDILKNNIWIEPKGVTFVPESIVLYKLRREYKSWFINDIVRIYHIDGESHLSGKKK